MSQYDMTIIYIPGEDNTVADALSHVPSGTFPGETLDPSSCNDRPGINAILSIMTDPSVLHTIQDGYDSDVFCQKVITSASSTLGVSMSNGLWYIGDRLLIPCFGTICEDLFHLAHDSSSHFGADKLYVTLHDTYYWPNMHCHTSKLFSQD
jgi:hypothetical protein